MKRLVARSRNCRDEQRKIRLHVLGFNRYCQMPIARTVLCPDVELPESVAARIAIGAGMRTVETETIQSGENAHRKAEIRVCPDKLGQILCRDGTALELSHS